MASVKSSSSRRDVVSKVGRGGRARKGRQISGEAPARSRFTPAWLISIVSCLLVGYVVVKNADRVSGVNIAGSGITFRGKSSPDTLPLAEQKQRSQQIQEQVEAEVSEASPLQTVSPVDLTGTWTTPDGAVSWTITIENGFVVFREQYATAPGVITAVGYGPFDGHTWSPRFQTVLGGAGTASLNLEDNGTLSGQAIISGTRFSLILRR